MVNFILFTYALLKAFIRGVVVCFTGVCMVSGHRRRVRFGFFTLHRLYADFKGGYEPYFFLFGGTGFSLDIVCRQVQPTKKTGESADNQVM